MPSTTTDRTAGGRTGGQPRIDESVFRAIAAASAPLGVARFVRWYACFATGGREE